MSVTVVTRLSEVLASGRIELAFAAGNVGEAVDVLLTPLFLASGLTAEAAEAASVAVKAREFTGSTTFGDMAIPHARVAGLPRIVAALGLNPDGVFRDGAPEVRLVLAFASPVANPVEHLKFLSGVAQVFRKDDTVTSLLEAPDALSVLSIIRSREG